MGNNGDNSGTTVSVIVCPSCGESYDSPDRVTDILRNSGFCVNLTCLHDLSNEPLEHFLEQTRIAGRRAADRRAV